MKIHQAYSATVAYRGNPDLGKFAPANGSKIKCTASWIIKESDFGGQWAGEYAMLLRDASCWIPSGDIENVKEISAKEFFEKKT